jgi:CheY-like chemotaxis protein
MQLCENVTDMATPQDNTHFVLVVEDEMLIRFMICDCLAEYGLRVIEASSADDAIELLESTDAVVDVVFSDVNMPGKADGFGLARWLQANRPDTHVMLASGVARKASAVEHGFPADSFVEKPYDVQRVAEQIQILAEARH